MTNIDIYMQKIIDFIKKLFGGKSSDSDSSDSSSSGFTLIELLIVIAVIGILAAALLVAIDPIDKIRAGNDTKVVNDVRSIYDAANRYYTQNGIIPTESGANIYSTVLVPDELKTIPVQPSGYSAYVYKNSGDNITVYGEVKSKNSLKKAGAAAGVTTYFVATGGGGCYTTNIPTASTLPDSTGTGKCK